MTKITEFMRTDVHSVHENTSFETLMCQDICTIADHVYVLDRDNHPVGLITTLELLKALVPPYLNSHLAQMLPEDQRLNEKCYEHARHLTARDVMSTDLPLISIHDSFLRASTMVLDTAANALPVVDEHGRLLGEMTRCDLVRYLGSNFCPLPDLRGTEGEQDGQARVH